LRIAQTRFIEYRRGLVGKALRRHLDVVPERGGGNGEGLRHVPRPDVRIVFGLHVSESKLTTETRSTRRGADLEVDQCTAFDQTPIFLIILVFVFSVSPCLRGSRSG